MNYYEILGVTKEATQKEIKASYRKLAKQYHPDVVKEDPVKTKRMYQIQEAYETLGNEEKRKRYDESLLKHKERGQARQQSTSKKENQTNAMDFTKKTPFEQFFGFQAGKGMETYQPKGKNSKDGSNISSEDLFASFFGIKK